MTLEHFDTIFAFVVIITGVSLLVTTLTQMASALLGLRGTNLRWGIKTLLANADPDLAKHAETIAEKALHHPLISDSSFSKFDAGVIGRWKLASAIRKEELVRILELLAKQPAAPAQPQGEETAAPAQDWQAALAKSLENLTREAADNITAVAPEVKKLFPNAPAEAQRLLDQLIAAGAQTAGNIQQWFDSVMDRVSQRFVVQMRIWTVVFSVALAFLLHLDAVRLFTQLSSDAVLRERLIGSADALIKKADEIPLTATNVNPAAYGEAMRLLIAGHTNEFKGVKAPAGLGSLEGGKAWLTNQTKTVTLTNLAFLVAEYETLVPQAAVRTAANNIRSLLEEKLQLDLVPVSNPGWISWSGPMPVPTAHFWGVVASAALLSLGAPFWFNLLKTLTNLRPVLALKEQKKSEEKSSSSDGSSTTSP